MAWLDRALTELVHGDPAGSGQVARIDRIERFLNTLEPANRARAVRRLRPRALRRLWALAWDRPVEIADLVPPDRADLEAVHHLGRNTLPIFTRFEKRFCRLPAGAAGAPVLGGYNEGLARLLVGPGYFICRAAPSDAPERVVIDYTAVPREHPAQWPAARGNERGLSRIVFGEMHDYLRRVSKHVTIGRAYRRGRETPNFFVLCRET